MPTLRTEYATHLAIAANALVAITVVAAYLAAAFYVPAMVGQYMLDETVSTANRWYDRSFEGTDEVERILKGRTMNAGILLHNAQMFGFTEVSAYEIRSPDGHLVYASNSGDLFASDSYEAQRALAAMAAETGRPIVQPLKQSDETSWVYLPVVRADGVMAIVGVGVENAQARRSGLAHVSRWLSAGAIIPVLALIGLGISTVLLRQHVAKHEALKYVAKHDNLTGLANRAVFLNALEERMASEREADRELAVHIIDLDGFKTVNDTMGHAVGDQLLQAVAGALRSVTREDDIVARLGGDEFVVLQARARDVSDVTTLGERIVRAVDNISQLGGVPVEVSASVGSALATPALSDPEVIQVQADVAVYRAKELGRNRHILFQEGMDHDLHQNQKLRTLLRDALRKDLFELHFQPLHGVSNDRLLGFEGLLRLRDPDDGLILPGSFMPVAEEIHLTGEIGAWVLKEACAAARTWPEELTVSVNLSAQQFTPRLVEDVTEALAESGLSAARLELEVTESLFLADGDAALDILRQLKDLGTRIVLDDFGAGYSSLSQLWKFPFDKLKVDRSCFEAVDPDNGVPEVLRTITSMAEAMNLSVTAEGIETAGQLALARETGYHELQGFLYSKPLSAAAAHDYMAGLQAADRASARSAAA